MMSKICESQWEISCIAVTGGTPAHSLGVNPIRAAETVAARVLCMVRMSVL